MARLVFYVFVLIVYIAAGLLLMIPAASADEWTPPACETIKGNADGTFCVYENPANGKKYCCVDWDNWPLWTKP